MTLGKIELPHGAITWIANDCNLSRTYVHEYTNDPAGWKGSIAAERKILESIENYRKHKLAEKEQNQALLNKVLSSSPFE